MTNNLIIEDELKKHERFLYKIAKIYGLYNHLEDLVQVGRMSLVRAAKTFDPKKEVKFLTYAGKLVRWDMQKYANKVRKHAEAEISSEYFPHISSGIDSVEEIYISLLNQDLQEKLKSCLKRTAQLSEDEINLLICRILPKQDEKRPTFQEIADKQGCSRQYIHKVYIDALNKVKCVVDTFLEENV